MEIKYMEIWKDYPENPLYEVSTNGQVRNKKTNLIRKPRLDNKGYYRINMYLHGKHTTIPVHRIVVDTFFPKNDELPHINHKDNNPKNNCISNLERCSHKQNMEHSAKQGRKGSGNKYTPEQIYSVKYTYIHLSSYETEKLTGVKHCTILRVRKGEQWAHI